MKNKKKKNELLLCFSLLIVIVFCIIFTIKAHTNHLKLHDLQVYYEAAIDLTRGKNVYDKSYGLATGYYKYAPFVLFFFIPFLFIPWKIFLCIYALVTITCVLPLFIVKLRLLIRKFSQTSNKFSYKTEQLIAWSIILTFVVYYHAFYREIYLGNINLILILLLSIFLCLQDLKYKMHAGFLLGFICLLKPHFILVLAVVFLLREYGSFFSALFSGIFLLIIPSVFFGIQKTILLTDSWFQSILIHNTPENYLNKTYTLQYFFAVFFPNFANQYPDIFLKLISGGVLSGLIICMVVDRNQNKISKRIFFYALSTALIPNVFLTDTEHFIYGTPFVALMFFTFKKKKKIFCWIIAILFIMLQSLPNLYGIRFMNYIGLFYFCLITILAGIFIRWSRNT